MKIEVQAAQSLINGKKTLSIAESCTGGLLSHRLTNTSGSSNFLKFTLIAYSNEAKIKLLKVPSSLIQKYGAVSEEIATKMSQNARTIFNTDFGISITGVAGPTGGSKEKPVGLTYISISTRFETVCIKCLFKGTREQIKQQASTQALKLLLEFLV